VKRRGKKVKKKGGKEETSLNPRRRERITFYSFFGGKR